MRLTALAELVERDRYEVLLVGSESLHMVRATHGRFFPSDDGHGVTVLATS